MDLPDRKNIRLDNYDYSRNGAYFVTVCTKKHEHYFWDYQNPNVGGDAHIAPPSYDYEPVLSTPLPYNLTKIGRTAEKYLLGIQGISKYVIMPNHIHIIITIDNCDESANNNGAMWASPPTQSVSQLIKSFKILVTKEIGFSPWQRSFYDRIIRNEREYTAYLRYIENNPINWENDEYY